MVTYVMKSKLNNSTKRTAISNLIAWGFVIASPLAILLTFSETANAGLISFMNSILGSEKASAEIKPSSSALNSQTMMLLTAHANFKPTSEILAESMPVDDGMALVADIAATNIPSDDPGSMQISSYTVRKGDTLGGIAKMFDVSVNTIVWANDISRTSTLKEGQVLLILPVSGVNYTVKKGDTIKGIVSRSKGDLDEVLRFNDLSINSTLQVGQTIVIPNGEITVGSASRSSGSNTSGQLIESGNLVSIAGFFVRPIDGGRRSQTLHGHNGVDLAAPVGTPIHASADGTVIISKNSGWNGGYGSFVVISHSNNTQTLYSHMSKTAVDVGEYVSQGETIGYIGMTGITTGPHLHFEIRGAKNPF